MKPRPASSWTVYILECSGGSLYTGITTDLLKRIRAHNLGRGARYTRMHGPVALRWYEPQPDRVAAMKREAQIKTWTRQRKIRLFAENL